MLIVGFSWQESTGDYSSPMFAFITQHLPANRALYATAKDTFEIVLAASRKPAIYLDCAVPDTFDGRFEALLLHMWPVFRGLGQGGPVADKFAQMLYDVCFIRLEFALRETGVGDLGVPRQVRRMMTAFYGRLEAYEQGIADRSQLAAILRRNLYGTVSDAGFSVPPQMLDYVQELASITVSLDDIRAARLKYPPL